MKLSSFISFFLIATATASNTIRGTEGENNNVEASAGEEGKRKLDYYYTPQPTMSPTPEPTMGTCYCNPPVVGDVACGHDNDKNLYGWFDGNDNSCFEKPKNWPTKDGCYAGSTACSNLNPVEVCLEEHTDCTTYTKGHSDIGCCDGLVCQPQSEWWSKCVDPTPKCVEPHHDCTNWYKKMHGASPCCGDYVCEAQSEWWAKCVEPPHEY